MLAQTATTELTIPSRSTTRGPPPEAGEGAVVPRDPTRPRPLGTALLSNREVPIMPQRVLSAELPAHVGETVLLHGWVHRRRTLKTVSFLVLRDRAGLAQVVGADLDGHPEETAVAVTGRVVANEVAPGGAELVDAAVTALSPPAQPPPFDLYRPEVRAGLAVQLDAAPLAFRHPGRRGALAASAAAARGFRATL